MASDTSPARQDEEPVFEACLSIYSAPGSALALPEAIANSGETPCQLEPVAIGLEQAADAWAWADLERVISFSNEFGSVDADNRVPVNIWCECEVTLPLKQLEQLLNATVVKRLLCECRPTDATAAGIPQPLELTLVVRVELSGPKGLLPAG